jgi:hypothetical protein
VAAPSNRNCPERRPAVKLPQSLFDRCIAYPRRKWIGPAAALLLLAVPVAAALSGGSLSQAWNMRGLMISPIVMLYILLMVPPIARTGDRVQQSLRSVTTLEDERFSALARNSTAVPLRNELAAVGVGALLGFLSSASALSSLSWQGFYWLLTSVLFYGLLFWTVYMLLVGIRFTRAVFRQPLKVDPLDPSPFEAFGRQSLLLAVVFVGGITFSLLMTIFEPGVFQRIEFWLLYILLLCLPVSVFFLNMYPVHRVLADARAKELTSVQKRLGAACRQLMDTLEKTRKPSESAEIVNALTAYESRLRDARTWPYNTSILRTLFFSILVPGGTLIARILFGAGFD